MLAPDQQHVTIEVKEPVTFSERAARRFPNINRYALYGISATLLILVAGFLAYAVLVSLN